MAILDLSVGQASALIAAIVFILQTLLPLLVPLLLIAFLTEKGAAITASAGTWSVIDRALQSTLWPTILRSDSAIGPGLSKRMNIIIWIGVLLVPLIAIAAIVTPLGLYEAIVARQDATAESFQYIRDSSVFGQGALGKSNYGLFRQCVNVNDDECEALIGNFTGDVTKGDNFIPQDLVDRFQSGLKSQMKSVSSIFDIQWRTFGRASSIIQNGTIDTGKYRQYTSVMLNDDFAVYEGLVVDTRNGGIGFRNHSVPPFSVYGSSWDEDILFMEPSTQCVDTNLTLRFASSAGGITETFPFRLLDRGGISKLDESYDWWTPQIDQASFDLYSRAYRGAWLNNYITKQNLTGVEGGRTSTPAGDVYELLKSGGTTLTQPYKLSLNDYLAYFPPAAGSTPINQTVIPERVVYPARTELSWPANYTMPEIGCIGQGQEAISNISTVFVKCGLMYSSPRSIEQPDLVVDVDQYDQAYEQQIYSCATAVKATIKTVTFTYNQTSTFEGVHVQDIEDKIYRADNERPLWGVEASGLTLRSLTPLWGLVDTNAATSENVTTIQNDHLWLPGGATTLTDVIPANDNFPAITIYRTAADQAYTTGAFSSSVGEPVIDYSGGQNYAMHRRWFNLSANASSAGRILDLIWTDLAANAVVGTRGWHTDDSVRGMRKRAEEAPTASGQVLVRTFARTLRYRWPYLIPAAIVLAVTAVLLLSVLILMITSATGVRKLNRLLDYTSLGMNLTEMLFPDAVSGAQSRKQWIRTDGRRAVTLSTQRPKAGEHSGSMGHEDENALASDGHLLAPQKSERSNVELREM